MERRQTTGNFHFITFSCHNRLPLLSTPEAKNTFLAVLEQTRQRHHWKIAGYVVMPEHVHLLTDEPPNLATVLQVLKQTTSRYLKPPNEERFWLPRYHDFNVQSHAKYLEKLRYIHRNPVTRGLVSAPEEYPWSTFRHYALHEPTPVQIESERSRQVPHP